MSYDRVTFAAARRKSQTEIIAALEPVVVRALERKDQGSETWWRAIVDAAQPLFDKIVRDDGGDPGAAKAEWAHLALDLTHSLVKTKQIHDYSPTLIATWVSSNILSYATEAAAKQGGEGYELEWISMHDSKVRHTHKDADRQRVRPGHPFRVGTSSMRRPGDTTAPIKEWINCRCTIAPVPLHDNQAASMDTGGRRTQGVTMNPMIGRATPTLYGAALVAAIDAAPDGSLVPWHGVLCVEGVWTGDRRRFQTGSLGQRELPLPLTFQKTSAPGHDNNVTVASIDWLERDDAGLWHAGGQIMPTPEADEMVGLLAHFGKFGVSIDADMAEFSFVDYDGGVGGADTDDMPGQDFSAGRICGACVVGIGAVAEAWVAIGEDPNHDYGEQGMAASIQSITLNEGGTPTATPDVTLIPDAITLTTSGVVEAGRGPGWVTDPIATERIHAYWTKPGHEGYEKIAWGTDGDFNRCRVLVGKEIAEHSPQDTVYLNQICAQWHHDATGFWPGHAPSEQASGGVIDTVALVASVGTAIAPSEWFIDPKFTKSTPMTLTDDGHYFGHIADWKTCHMAFNEPGVCRRVEPSTNGYAYYRTGEVMTDKGPVATGPITLATGHADRLMRMRPALAHYDNTGTAVADVACGDDEFGIWVNGWVRPWISEEKKYELRAHPPSIDQRYNPNTRNLDLIAVLSVNAPGLPVLRYGIADGVTMSLIASTAVVEAEAEADVVAELADAVAEALERRQAEREQFEALELEDA